MATPMFRAGVASLAFAIALSGGGCQKPPEPTPIEGTTLVAFSGAGTLYIDIENPRGGAMTLVAAAEAALRARGYVLRERTHLDDDPIKVYGKRAGAGYGEGVVAIRPGVTHARVEVRVEPFGNQDECREIMGLMLGYLGYGERAGQR